MIIFNQSNFTPLLQKLFMHSFTESDRCLHSKQYSDNWNRAGTIAKGKKNQQNTKPWSTAGKHFHTHYIIMSDGYRHFLCNSFPCSCFRNAPQRLSCHCEWKNVLTCSASLRSRQILNHLNYKLVSLVLHFPLPSSLWKWISNKASDWLAFRELSGNSSLSK